MLRRPFRTARLLAGLLALQALLAGLYYASGRGRSVRHAGVRAEALDGREAAPIAVLRRPNGEAIELASLRGRFLLVHFWASWCAPCRRELPAFLAQGRALARERALTVLLVASRDDMGAIGRFWNDRVPSEVVLDPGGEVAGRFGVHALPETFLVSPEGRLLTRYRGAQDWAAPEVGRHLAGELQRGP